MGKKGASGSGSSSGSSSASASSSSNQASPPPPPSAPSAVAHAALEKRVANLEEKQKKRNLFAIVRQKKDLLNAESKSYSDNFLVKGVKYSMREFQGDDEKEERCRAGRGSRVAAGKPRSSAGARHPTYATPGEAGIAHRNERMRNS